MQTNMNVSRHYKLTILSFKTGWEALLLCSRMITRTFSGALLCARFAEYDDAIHQHPYIRLEGWGKCF